MACWGFSAAHVSTLSFGLLSLGFIAENIFSLGKGVDTEEKEEKQEEDW